MKPELELYVKNGCPFCAKVESFMDANDITLPMRNIDESSEAREHLIAVGGKRQVPCLFIDGKAMYESDGIIAYLQEHLLNGKANDLKHAQPSDQASEGAHCSIDGGCTF